MTAPDFARSYARWVMRLRYPLLAVIVLLTVVAAYWIPRIDLRNDPDTLLPAHNRHVLTNAYVEKTFGMANFIVVGLEVEQGDIYQPWFLNKVRDLHHRLAQLPYARPDNFISVAAKKVRYIWGSEGGLDIQRLMPRTGISEDAPERAAVELQTVRDGLERNEVIRDMLLSPDRRATFVIADFDDRVKEHYLDWVLQVKAILAEEDDPRVRLYVAGEPYFFASMLVDLKENWYLFLISILLVVGVLRLESRLIRASLLPLVGVGVSIVWTLGLMGYSGYQLTTMMVLTPVLIFAIGIGHSIQVMRRYFEELELHDCHQRAAMEAIAKTMVPASIAIVTDVIGFLALSTVDISFYRAYSYFGQFGMVSLLLTCTTLVPVLLSVLPPPRRGLGISLLEKWETRLGNTILGIISGPKKWVPIALVVGLMLLSASYLPRIELGINFAEAAFKPSSPVIHDLRALNRLTPGVISFNIPFIGKEPEALRDVDLLTGIARMEDTLRNDPNIGFTLSFADYIRLLNKHINENDEAHWRIPEDQELLEQLIFVYEMGADPQDFSTVVDYDYTNGQLVGYINTMDPAQVHRVSVKIMDYIRIHASDEAFRNVTIGLGGGLGSGADQAPGIGGFAGTTEAAREVSEAQWLRNPLSTALMIFVVIAILFRSVTMSVLILVMVSITLLTQYGLAGYFSSVGNWGGNLHFGNLVTLSIAMGLSVDYSIYLASRFKSEYTASEDLDQALANTLSTTGSAVVLSVVVLLCSLAPLLMTDLANTWGLAMYIGVAVHVAVFTAMTILPILIKAVVNLPLRLSQFSNLLNIQVSRRTQQLRKEKQELSEALELLRRTQVQLVESEKMASLGGLVAGVAHEINTPVGNALTVASHLQEEIEQMDTLFNEQRMKKSKLKEFLQNSREAIHMLSGNLVRAAQLVQSFKQVAVDQTSEEKRRFRVKDYLQEIVLSLRPNLKKTKIKVDIRCPEDLEIQSYPGAIAQVISNLVLNALTHAYVKGQEGTITIEVSYRADWVNSIYPMPGSRKGTQLVAPERDPIYIRFADDGKGIPAKDLHHVFEPFFTTRRGAGGSGLGLHIVYNIVTQTLHGDIRCQSEVGKGTEFFIRVPPVVEEGKCNFT